MSTVPAVTMQDLELEHAELLPRRETLWSHSSPTFNVASVANGNGNGNGNGNHDGNGFFNFASGNADGNGNGVLNGNGNSTTIIQY